jgi:hypothetical protein
MGKESGLMAATGPSFAARRSRLTTVHHDNLLQAAELLEEVLSVLNTKTKKCGSCGRLHQENLSEFRAHIELQAVALKLRRFADSEVFHRNGKGS